MIELRREPRKTEINAYNNYYKKRAGNKFNLRGVDAVLNDERRESKSVCG